MPGRTYSPRVIARPHLLVVVDTSMSMSSRELHEIVRHLSPMSESGPGRGEVARSRRGLNDVTIAKAATVSRIVEFTVFVGDKFVSEFRADGLIVSSPTGSTAYNLAAGGPILHPSIDAVVLTPICPHMLSYRPLVIPASAPVRIRIRSSASPVHVTVDGQWSVEVTPDDEVEVGRGAGRLKLVTSSERDYFEVLRTKLKWGDALRLRG